MMPPPAVIQSLISMLKQWGAITLTDSTTTVHTVHLPMVTVATAVLATIHRRTMDALMVVMDTERFLLGTSKAIQRTKMPVLRTDK